MHVKLLTQPVRILKTQKMSVVFIRDNSELENNLTADIDIDLADRRLEQ